MKTSIVDVYIQRFYLFDKKLHETHNEKIF